MMMMMEAMVGGVVAMIVTMTMVMMIKWWQDVPREPVLQSAATPERRCRQPVEEGIQSQVG
jgi:hypothetical protein